MTTASDRAPRAMLLPLDAGLVAFLAVVTVLFALSYATYPVSPFNAPSGGDWFGWWDQSSYLKSAEAFARGDLAPGSHWYPPGYALLGAPFVHLFPRDPFAVVNLVFTLVFAAGFLAYFRPVIGYWATVLSFFASLLLPAVLWLPWRVDLPFWLQFTIPWNSVPVAAAFMLVIVMMRTLRERRSVLPDIVIGASAGLVAVTRPIDVIPLAPIALIYLWRRLTPSIRWRNLAAGVAGLLAVLGPVAVLMLAIHGGLETPYAAKSAAIGLSLANIPYKAFIVLLDPSTAGGPLSLLEVAPLFYLAIPLAVVWAILDRRNGLVPVLMALAALVTYLAYNDFFPHNMFLFFLVHYFVWALPVLMAGGVAGLFLLVREKRHALLLVSAVIVPLLVASLRLKEVAVPAQVETAEETGGVRYRITMGRPRTVDAIDFRGILSTRSATDVPLYDGDLRADGEDLALFKGYRAFTVRRGTRFVLTGPATAREFEVLLDDSFAASPDLKTRVRPTRFELGLDWPWKRLAGIRWRGRT